MPVPVKCGCVITGSFAALPGVAGPPEPAVLLLVEDVQSLVEELGVLGAHAGAAHDRRVGLDLAHQEDVLAVVHLMPDALQHLAEERRVGIAPVHELADVRQAHVAVLQLLVGQHADAAGAGIGMSLEGEVHLVDAVALGGLAEGGFGALRSAAEENAVLWLHGMASGRRLSRIAAAGVNRGRRSRVAALPQRLVDGRIAQHRRPPRTRRASPSPAPPAGARRASARRPAPDPSRVRAPMPRRRRPCRRSPARAAWRRRRAPARVRSHPASRLAPSCGAKMPPGTPHP